MKKLLLSISQWCPENCPRAKLSPPPHLVRARVCVKIRVRITVGDNFYGHHVNILGKIYLLIVGTL